MLFYAAFAPHLSYAVFTPRFGLLPAGCPLLVYLKLMDPKVV